MGSSKSKAKRPTTAADVRAVAINARDKIVSDCTENVVVLAQQFAKKGYQSMWVVNDSDLDVKRMLFDDAKRPTTRKMIIQALHRLGFVVGPEVFPDDHEDSCSEKDDCDDESFECNCFETRVEISWPADDPPPPYPPLVSLE